ncbi:MFS transporter [Kamptonema cortianum]|nr:MFS transporter [Kamptonema cortianum]
MGVLIFILNIDYTAVNLTLVPIAEEIQTDLNNLQWLLSAYVLVWAAFVIPAGRLADIYGKRNALIAGLIIFMAGSCLAGLGQSLEVLILGRALQGVGAAIFSAPAWAFVFTTASPEKQGFVMGIILSFAGFGLATGPTLAGLIIQELSWRWIFYVNIPLGFLVIATLLIYSQKDEVASNKQKVDILGTLLLSAGLCLCVYALNQIEVWGLQSPLLWGTAALGLSLLGVYYLRDRMQEFRMVPPHLFSQQSLHGCCCGGILHGHQLFYGIGTNGSLPTKYSALQQLSGRPYFYRNDYQHGLSLSDWWKDDRYLWHLWPHGVWGLAHLIRHGHDGFFKCEFFSLLCCDESLLCRYGSRHVLHSLQHGHDALCATGRFECSFRCFYDVHDGGQYLKYYSLHKLCGYVWTGLPLEDHPREGYISFFMATPPTRRSYC